MGNLCGKQTSTDDAFSTPGRTVGSAPPSGPRTASVPQKKTAAPKVGGPARTLGGGAEDNQTPEEARRKAAEAAEARASKNGKGGKLATNLAAQKRQTRTDTLQEASQQNLQQRESDANAKIRQYD